MRAEVKSVRFLGDGKKITVPFFQRNYVWKKDNWEELLKSFENDESAPFLGSLILKDITQGNATEAMIVDGQQRLTTISILAKAIYDSLLIKTETISSGIIGGIQSFLFYKNNAADDFSSAQVKISHSRVDRENYNRVMELHMHSEESIGDIANSKILQCYDYYCKCLSKRTVEELKNLFNLMFNEDRKVFVVIELDRNDATEQSIFDTINRAGIRLSTADIIKNTIFQRCLEYCKNDLIAEQHICELYDKRWGDFFYCESDIQNVWDETRIFGNQTRSNLEFLLYCVAAIKWGKTKDLFSDLGKMYSEKIQSYTLKQLEELVNEIYLYGVIYKEKILDLQSSFQESETAPSVQYNQYEKRLLIILEKFKVQMFYPYVLKCLAEMKNNKTLDFSLEFGILESFVVRRKLSGKGTNDYSEKCIQAIHSEKGIASVLVPELIAPESRINNQEIEGYLKKVNNDVAKTILYFVELFRRNDPSFDSPKVSYWFTLEHIMPKKWEQSWSNVPVVDENGVQVIGSEDEIKAKRNQAVFNLGNMILLTAKLNNALSNSSFKEKVEGIPEKKPGYMKMTSMLLTTEIVKQYENGDVIWDEKHIQDRTKRLLVDILTMWPNYENILIEEKQENEIKAQYTASKVDMDFNDFSKEAMQDPLRLLAELDAKQSQAAMNEQVPGSEMMLVSQEEFISSVSVQKELIEKYVREGKIVPDVKKDDGARKINYYKKETMKSICEQYGWTMITSSNKKDFFLRFVEKMNMSFAYKPLLLKAFLEQSENGMLTVWEIVVYFKKYYQARRAAGLVVERESSVFAKDSCSDFEAKDVVLKYPVNRYKTIGAMEYSKELDTVVIVPEIWTSLSEREKQTILDQCNDSLTNYFAKLEQKESV